MSEELLCGGGCGRAYSAGPDVVIPDEAWMKIAPRPDGGGVLCPNCMHDRLVAAGYGHGEAPGFFMSGPMCSNAVADVKLSGEPDRRTWRPPLQDGLSAPVGEVSAVALAETANVPGGVAGDGWRIPNAGDWTEDFPHENGNYLCICRTCGETFTGHKRRVQCRACAMQSTAANVQPTESAEGDTSDRASVQEGTQGVSSPPLDDEGRGTASIHTGGGK